jgi:hypothetical protein
VRTNIDSEPLGLAIPLQGFIVGRYGFHLKVVQLPDTASPCHLQGFERLNPNVLS